MKAAVCYEFGKPLVVEEVELDPPEAGEVKVRLAACAICQSDIHYMNGAWGGTLPLVLGHEAAGIVHALLSCSGDCELLEITMPAEFSTEDA